MSNPTGDALKVAAADTAMSDLKQLAIASEHYETPQWAADAILQREPLSPYVVDPCCGTGVLSEAAKRARPDACILPLDIHDWGYPCAIGDWLDTPLDAIAFPDTTCFMNPPFSKAVEFVLAAKRRGFGKIIMFQRFAFWESRKRRDFWAEHPPARVYICGDRADCWRHDIPPEGRGSSTPTAHAWFCWGVYAPIATTLHHIYKD